MRRPSGFTLVSVLVTTAISGILAVLILAIVDNAAKVMVRGNALEAFEGIMRTTASVLANKTYCDHALRGANPATKIVYNVQDNPVGPPPGGNEVEIQNIYVQGDPNPHPIIYNYSNPNATAIVSRVAGSTLSNVYSSARVNYIRFRERNRGVGRSKFVYNGVEYDVYLGEVEIDVGGLSATPGGTIRRRIPYTAVVHPTNRTIDGCFQQDTSVNQLCRAMDGTYDPNSGTCTEVNQLANPIDCAYQCDPASGNPSAPTALCPGGMTDCPPSATCIKMFYVAGFDYTPGSTNNDPSRSDPVCACKNICWTAGASSSASSSAASSSAAPAAPSGN